MFVDELRSAAATLEKAARLWRLAPNPAAAPISADWLRKQADILDAPIPPEETA